VLNLIFVMQWGILGAAAIYVISELALAMAMGANHNLAQSWPASEHGNASGWQ